MRLNIQITGRRYTGTSFTCLFTHGLMVHLLMRPTRRNSSCIKSKILCLVLARKLIWLFHRRENIKLLPCEHLFLGFYLFLIFFWPGTGSGGASVNSVDVWHHTTACQHTLSTHTWNEKGAISNAVASVVHFQKDKKKHTKKTAFKNIFPSVSGNKFRIGTVVLLFCSFSFLCSSTVLIPLEVVSGHRVLNKMTG